jgi:hypothetical protein
LLVVGVGRVEGDEGVVSNTHDTINMHSVFWVFNQFVHL